MVALTPEEINDPTMQERIQGIEALHEPVLCIPIPQTNARSQLTALQAQIRQAKDTFRDRFGYEITKIYNSNKDPILRSVEEACRSAGVTVFTRTFHANIRRPESVEAQIRCLRRLNEARDTDSIVEINLAGEQDLQRLELMTLTFRNHGFLVGGGPVSETATRLATRSSAQLQQPRRRIQVLIDGFSADAAINRAAIDGRLTGFTVDDSDLERKSRTIQSALNQGMTPVFRFPTEMDHGLGRRDPKRLARWAQKARRQFRSQYRAKLDHVLLPFTSDYPRGFERRLVKAGFKILRSTLHLNSGYLQLLDGARGTEQVVCWQLGAEQGVEGVRAAIRRFREQADIVQRGEANEDLELVDTEEERLGERRSESTRRHRRRQQASALEAVDTEEERLKSENRQSRRPHHSQHQGPSTLGLIVSLLTA